MAYIMGAMGTSCGCCVLQVICHGIPDRRELEEGDIVNVDVSCLLNGYHADLNETFAVGKISADKEHLVTTTYQASDAT